MGNVLLCAALTLSACGGGASAAPNIGASAPSATAPTYRIVPPSGIAEIAPYNALAAQKFGDPNVMAAYEEAVAFASTVDFQEHRVFNPNSKLSVKDWADVAAYLTPSAATALNGWVKQAIATPDNDTSPMDANNKRLAFVTFWNLIDPPHKISPRADGLLVDNQTVSNTSVFVNAAGQLVVGFHHSATFHFLVDGKPAHMVYRRDIQFPMVQSPAGSKYPWLIADEDGSGQYDAGAMDDGSPVPSPAAAATSPASHTP